MPEKLGNGGHGREEYDPNTGKYVADGQPNKRYDNPNEEKDVLGKFFGLKQQEMSSNIEPDAYSKIFINRQENFLNNDGAIFEYPDYVIIGDKENHIIFKNLDDLAKYEEKVIKEIAFNDLLRFSNGKKEFPVEFGNGEKFVIRTADDLYYYIKRFNDEIIDASIDKNLLEKFNVSDDDKIAQEDALRNLGMTRDEYIELYNSMDNVKYKMGKNAKKERKAVITLGLPASGKSITGDSNDILAGVEIDADIGKDTIPEYQRNKALVSAVHNESGALRDVVLERCLEEGYNLSIPVVGKSVKSVMKRVKQLRDNGYDIQIAYVDIPFEQNISRSVTRAVKTGRYTNMSVLLSSLGNTLTVYNLLKQSPEISGYICFDNRQKPTAIEAKNWKYNTKK